MLKDRNNCNICNKKLHHYTLCHDPYFYVYKWESCGFFVLFKEMQKYMEIIEYPIIEKSILENFKQSNPQIDYDSSVFLIGNHDEIQKAKEPHFEQYLQKGQFHFVNIIYLNLQGEKEW